MTGQQPAALCRECGTPIHPAAGDVHPTCDPAHRPGVVPSADMDVRQEAVHPGVAHARP